MKTFLHNPLAAAVLVLSAAGLAGCGGANTQDLEQYVQEVSAQQPTRIEPLPEFKPFETFLYQAADLRSPFRPMDSVRPDRQMIQEGGSGIRPDLQRPREPLEEAPLDALRMVGTLEQFGESWALVRMNDGTIHRVQPGNYAGHNHGKITRITEDRVELTEIIPDGLGGWQERQASLALSE
ncbi:MAG: pilus assembly protein PilP [Gammaproteobacteria bacterium]